jgi:hypothetical protein
MAIPEGLDVEAFAHDIIDVHGSGAAELAREKARTAILSGRIAPAKSWLKVLAMIQRQQAARVELARPAQEEASTRPHPPSTATPVAQTKIKMER